MSGDVLIILWRNIDLTGQIGYTENMVYLVSSGVGYTAQELSERLPKIQKLDRVAEKTFVFANNHWRGQAVSTIRQLRVMLD
ncbi:DUF72 domain-containing protein [Chloroflexota bacterium]